MPDNAAADASLPDGGTMEALAEIEALAAIEGRGAGMEGEHRAAEHLAGRLRSLGRDADLEPAVVRPEYHRPTDTPDRLDPEVSERAFEFCSQLIEKIDDQIPSHRQLSKTVAQATHDASEERIR
jgi:hypothetical protein